MQAKTNTPKHSLKVGNYSVLTNDVLGKGATGTVYRGILSVIQVSTISPNSLLPSRPSISPPFKTKQLGLFSRMKNLA